MDLLVSAMASSSIRSRKRARETGDNGRKKRGGNFPGKGEEKHDRGKRGATYFAWKTETGGISVERKRKGGGNRVYACA